MRKIMSKKCWLTLMVILAILDQVSKTWAVGNFAYGVIYKIIPMFNIQLVYNYGISFSLFSASMYYYLILIFGMIITMGLITWLVKIPSEQKLKIASITFILGGAIGNLVDRAFRGYVVDFIDFTIGHWHWYNFNLADVWISFGAFLMILDLFINKDADKEKVSYENHIG